MSRHVYDQNGIRTVIGWDPPLQTFFIQQGPIDWDGKWLNNGEGPQHWLGTRFQAIPDIQEFINIVLELKIDLSVETMEKLKDDQRHNV